jgi:hypothetical protein
MGVIPPSNLGNYLRTDLGTNGPGSSGHVPLFNALIRLPWK